VQTDFLIGLSVHRSLEDCENTQERFSASSITPPEYEPDLRKHEPTTPYEPSTSTKELCTEGVVIAFKDNNDHYWPSDGEPFYFANPTLYSYRSSCLGG
jgi:hypothetical protein